MGGYQGELRVCRLATRYSSVAPVATPPRRLSLTAPMFSSARNLFRNNRAASRSLQKQKRSAGGTTRMRPDKWRLYQMMFGGYKVPQYQPKTVRRLASLATHHVHVYDQTFVVRVPSVEAPCDAIQRWYPNLYQLLLQEEADYAVSDDYWSPSHEDYEEMWDRLDYQEWMCD